MAETRTATVACPFCETLNRVDLSRIGSIRNAASAANRFSSTVDCVSDASFDRVTADTTVPVLVDFTPTGAARAKSWRPLLDDVARRKSGEVLVTKLDTDKNPPPVCALGFGAFPR